MKKTTACILSLVLSVTPHLLADGAVPEGVTPSPMPPPAVTKPLKVLMIGNSFSVCVLNQMPRIAEELGLKLDICSLFIGGCSLARHAENAKNTDAKPYSVSWKYMSVEPGKEPFRSALGGEKGKSANIPEMLAADAWDVVTIQQASHESWKPDSYEPYGTELLDLIAKLAPQARVYVQQTWSYTPWDGRLAKWNLTPESMYERLEAAYADFAKAHGLKQISMGKAVQLYRRELPVAYGDHDMSGDVCGTDSFEEKDGKWRHVGDAFHLNGRGHYLQGLVWTATLFGADVTKCKAVPKALAANPERAELMRGIAMRVAKGE